MALEDSLHRYLAEDVKADHDVPAFNRSPYDGFAIRASDSKRLPVTMPSPLKSLTISEPAPCQKKNSGLMKRSAL